MKARYSAEEKAAVLAIVPQAVTRRAGRYAGY